MRLDRSVLLWLLCAVFGILVYISSVVLTPAMAANPNQDPPLPAGQFESEAVLVKFKPRVVSFVAEASLSLQGFRTIDSVQELGVRKVAVAAGQEDDAISSLMGNPLVEYAEPNYLRYAGYAPNDTYYNDQWALKKLRASLAWNTTQGVPAVKVAILDSGFDYLHRDRPRNLVGGWNIVSDTPNTQDDAGHGTTVTGVIAAAAGNGDGVAGLAPLVTVIEVKIGYPCDYPSGVCADALSQMKGIVYTVAQGARVVNISYGGLGYSQGEQDAIDYAWKQGTLVVASAGNESSASVHYPAGYGHVLGVGASDQYDQKASFSNYGTWVSVVAPGIGIKTTIWPPSQPRSWFERFLGISKEYADVQGTSYAAPYTAATAALVWSVNPKLTAAQVTGIITSTAVDLGLPGKDVEYGWGRIDTYAAVRTAYDTLALPSPDRRSIPTTSFGKYASDVRGGYDNPPADQKNLDPVNLIFYGNASYGAVASFLENEGWVNAETQCMTSIIDPKLSAETRYALVASTWKKQDVQLAIGGGLLCSPRWHIRLWGGPATDSLGKWIIGQVHYDTDIPHRVGSWDTAIIREIFESYRTPWSGIEDIYEIDLGSAYYSTWNGLPFSGKALAVKLSSTVASPPSVPAAPTPLPVGTPTGLSYGMAVRSVRDGPGPTGSYSTSLVDTKLAGFGWVESYVEWARLEPSKGFFDWSWADDIVNQSLAYGLRPVLRIYMPPAWARSSVNPKAPPNNPKDLGDFMAALVQHMGDKVSGYIILNEPNISTEWGGGTPDAAAYMALLKEAYARAKSTNPRAVIVSAALAPTNDNGTFAADDRGFLQRMYDNGLKAYSDVVGVNALGFAYSPDDTSDQNGFNFSRVKQLHDVMVVNGDTTKQVWALEMGWLANAFWNLGEYDWMKVAETTRAQYLVRAYQKAYNEWPWMGVMFIWNMDFGVGGTIPPQSEPEQAYFGLLDYGGAGLPSYEGVRDMPKPPATYTPTPTLTPTYTPTPTYAPILFPTATPTPTSMPRRGFLPIATKNGAGW